MTIGMIGAQNSHAAHFLNAINSEKLYEGVRAGYIYGGDDPETCAKLATLHNLEDCPDEETLIEKSDAVVITYRKGSMHYKAAMKALHAGKPAFIDKPFTTDVYEAKKIVDYANENGLLICGGSNLKGISGIADISGKIEPGDTVVFSYFTDPASEYDGYFFYGIHTVELCLSIFGLDYKNVSAVNNDGMVVSIVSYPENTCVIVTSPEFQTFDVVDVVVHGKKATTHYPLALDYQNVGSDELIDMVKTGKPPRDYSFYETSIKLINEIVQSAGLQ